MNGPLGRLPAGDEEGFIWMLFDDNSVGAFHSDKINTGFVPTHWALIPKAPPLPKPVEKTQEEKDYEIIQNIVNENTPVSNPSIYGYLYKPASEAFRKGRADGRRQLAAECLGLFVECSIPGAINNLEGVACFRTSKALRALYELLTEAAKP